MSAAAGTPRMTIAVCTRDRPEALDRCLTSLAEAGGGEIEVIVVDNAPSDGATESLVGSRHPTTRYVREERPGLDRARNRAIAEARGPILAFTDDDVVVDPGWPAAILEVFAEAPEVMAMTGQVEPLELVAEAQRHFEAYGGFRGADEPRVLRRGPETRGPELLRWATQCGTGANMAFRRIVFDEVGGFDPALDVGTPTAGGGDLDLFYRILRAGHPLRYEPRAVVRHRHRPDRSGLEAQIRGWGSGLVAFLARTARTFPSERGAVVRFGLRWWTHQAGRLLRAYVGSPGYPPRLILCELRGAAAGIGAYRRSEREHGE